MIEILNHGICQVSIAPVRSAASDTAEIVTQLLYGDGVEILEKGKPWIKIYFPQDDYEGWMDFKQLTYIQEEDYKNYIHNAKPVLAESFTNVQGPLGIQLIMMGSVVSPEMTSYTEPEGDMIDTALQFLNAPYLWGGKTVFGVDCSGLIQVVAKVHGKNLPRNASDQVNTGELIKFEDRAPGDVPFFINEKGIVHHVGILINEDEILHASGHVRIDKFDEKGIFREDFDDYTHKFHSIRRI